MRDLREAKAMAKGLRQALAARDITLSHSECLEVVARQAGLADWNTLAAKLSAEDAEPSRLDLPDGWILTGTNPDRFVAGIDPDATRVALIRDADPARPPTNGDFATLMQTVRAEAYRGRRIRLQAELKADVVRGAGTLWLRVDGANARDMLAFDNMEQRTENGPVAGTTGWVTREIVLDVPDEAVSLNYGFYQRGTGRTRCRNVSLDSVDDDIGTTDVPQGPLDGPTNLDFGRTVS